MISAFLCWGTPFGPLFWGRCFGSVGRLCPKPQFMGLPFLHRCLVIFAFLYSISGPPFSPLFLMCFGSVGRACPKPQFMGPPFYKHVWRFLPFHSGASLLSVTWRAAKASSRQTSQKLKKSAPKKEVISILKNARFKGSGAKSWPWTFLCISDNFLPFQNGGPSLNSDVESCQNAKIELQKCSWPGFGPKLPFPDIPKRSFNRDLEGCQNAQNRASKGLLAGILSKRTLSNDFQEDIFYSDLEASKRLLVRIWFKLAVSMHSQKQFV